MTKSDENWYENFSNPSPALTTIMVRDSKQTGRLHVQMVSVPPVEASARVNHHPWTSWSGPEPEPSIGLRTPGRAHHAHPSWILFNIVYSNNLQKHTIQPNKKARSEVFRRENDAPAGVSGLRRVEAA